MRRGFPRPPEHGIRVKVQLSTPSLHTCRYSWRFVQISFKTLGPCFHLPNLKLRLLNSTAQAGEWKQSPPGRVAFRNTWLADTSSAHGHPATSKDIDIQDFHTTGFDRKEASSRIRKSHNNGSNCLETRLWAQTRTVGSSSPAFMDTSTNSGRTFYQSQPHSD